jgi:hypothetical protein
LYNNTNNLLSLFIKILTIFSGKVFKILNFITIAVYRVPTNNNNNILLMIELIPKKYEITLDTIKGNNKITKFKNKLFLTFILKLVKLKINIDKNITIINARK